MPFGELSQAWSTLYDHLRLNSDLEARMYGHATAADGRAVPAGLDGISDETARLKYSSSQEIGDYFLARRDYVEAVATLDIIISAERAIRMDLAARLQGLKDTSHGVGAALVAVEGHNGQPPAARRLLKRWRLAPAADDTLIDAVDQGMQYRNWLVHGTLGPPPFSPTPFLLDAPVAHLLELIDDEP